MIVFEALNGGRQSKGRRAAKECRLVSKSKVVKVSERAGSRNDEQKDGKIPLLWFLGRSAVSR